jgi:hypothetical protein
MDVQPLWNRVISELLGLPLDKVPPAVAFAVASRHRDLLFLPET